MNDNGRSVFSSEWHLPIKINQILEMIKKFVILSYRKSQLLIGDLYHEL